MLFSRTPRTDEDALLDAYWQQARGRLDTEVPIAGPRGHAAWAAHFTTRRLGGVRVTADLAAEGIVPFVGHAEECQRAIHRSSPDLIEVKVKRNHTAIGQMIAGHDLFSEQYGVSPARLTIVCGVGDAALEWVCQRQGMIVSKLLQRPYPHKHNADHSCEASISRPVHA